MIRIRIIIFATLLSLLGFGTVFVTPSVSYAKVSEKSLKKKLKKATALYDEIEIEDAEDVLTDAISDAASDNVSGPVVAKLHIMLGIVRFANGGDENEAEEQFVEAVRADRKVDIPGVYKTPVLEKILERALEIVPKKKKKKKKKKGEDNPGFEHEIVTVTDAYDDLEIEVTVSADVPVYKIFLYMRRLEEKKYTKSELEPTDETTFAVEVPGEEIYTSQLDYYIIAENRSGEVIARAGSKSDPNNVVVMGSGDDDKKRKPKDPEEDEDDESSKAIFVDLSVGTGEGYLTGGENNSPTANPTRPVTQGFAFTGGHVNLGFGAMLGKQMQLGLEFRVQFAPPQDFDILEGTSSVDPGNGFWDTKVPCFGLGAPVECMARLKFKYFFEDSIFFTTVGTGVGRLRNLLQLRSSATNKSCINQPTEVEDGKEFCFVRDTVRNGWFHFGLGAGVNIPLNNTFSLYIDTFAMVLLPDTSVNIDLQGGLQMRF